MRFKLLCLCVLLLASSPVFGQQISFDAVWDGKSITTAKTGEPFTQLYRLRYLDLAPWGREIVVDMESINPKNLPVKFEGGLELIKIDVSDPYVKYNEDGANEITLELVYYFMVIDPKKYVFGLIDPADLMQDSRKLPSFKVRWAEKNIGQDIAGLQFIEDDQYSTHKVPYNYTTTATEGIWLRDLVDLGDSSGRAYKFWVLSRIVLPVMILIPVVMLVRTLRSPSAPKKDQVRADSGSDSSDYAVEARPLTFNQIYRRFLKELKKSIPTYSAGEDSLEAEARFLLSFEKKTAYYLMAVLKSRLVNVNPGDTPAVLGVYIEKNIKPGSFKNSLIWLQKKLDAYDRDIQSGDPSNLQNGNLVMEIREIKHQVRRLKRRWRLLDGLKKVAGKFGFKRR